MIPTKAGWYFAKWRIANDGTRDGDELTPSDNIECVDVFENTLDPSDDEHLLAHVAGVERSQSIENFYWIGPVPMPSVKGNTDG